MGQTTSKNTKNHKNKRKSISKLFHTQTGSIWFQIGSIVHRSVPTNLKWFPNCSHAHALFQDRFKDVQVGSRWHKQHAPSLHGRDSSLWPPPCQLTMTSNRNIAKLPLRWCWWRKRPPERNLRVEERRCPTFSPLGPVSPLCFTIPFDYVTVSLLVFKDVSDM